MVKNKEIEMKNEIAKTYFFKCDPDGVGKNDHTLGIQVCLSVNKDNRDVFSCNATLKTNRGRFIEGGQTHELLKELIDNNRIERVDEAKELYRLWIEYHCNSLNAGTRQQMRTLKEKYGKEFPSYSEQCEYLKSQGLYEVMHEGKPYVYGSAWLYFEIPSEDFEIIKSLVC